MSAAAWRRWMDRANYPPELTARLVDAITHGVEIGYVGDRTCGRMARNARSTTDPKIARLIDEAIAEDVVAGYKHGPFDMPPFTPFHVSPLGGVPKGENGEKIRVIHNLSHPFMGNSINANIPREEYIMQRFEDAIAAVRRLGRGCWLSKFDVRSAFKLVPVRPEDRPLLGLVWAGKYYFEVVLPFGLRTSGYRWEEFAVALHWLAERQLGVACVFHYVDDFLFVAPPADGEAAKRQRAAFQQVCSELGVPLAEEKLIGPTHELDFLGVLIDTDRMECRLTDKRIAKLRSLLQAWGKDNRRVSCDELMSMVGKLEWATVVVRAGSAFLKRLRGEMMTMKKARGDQGARPRRLSVEARIEIGWWLDIFLTTTGNRRAIIEPPWVEDSTMELYTDACDTGYGACFGNRWFQGRWTAAQLAFARVNVRISMPYLELHALVHAAVTWGHLWRGRRITFRCDAEAAVLAVQKMRSRKDSMSELLRLLYATAVRHDFEFRCVHVAGKTNAVADALSRGCTMQELRRVLPQAEATETAAPPLPVDAKPMVPWDPEEDRRLRADLPPPRQ
jgi:hypothetical protein